MDNTTLKETLREMSLGDIQTLVRKKGPFSTSDKHTIGDQLASRCDMIGGIWDTLDDVDPDNSGRYGSTQNRKSKTYKLRKAAGYSYP